MRVLDLLGGRLVATAGVACVLGVVACGSGGSVTPTPSAPMGMGGVAMMSAGLFLVTWLVMMVAMMFPSVAPMVLAYAGVTRSRGQGMMPSIAFVLGYIVVWIAAGLAPLTVLQAFNHMWIPTPSWLPRVGGAVIVLAGVYQFTPLKYTCLSHCRSPLGFILTHDFGPYGSRTSRCVAWSVLPRLLLGADGGSRGGGTDEHRLDGGDCGNLLRREERARRRTASAGRRRRLHHWRPGGDCLAASFGRTQTDLTPAWRVAGTYWRRP